MNDHPACPYCGKFMLVREYTTPGPAGSNWCSFAITARCETPGCDCTAMTAVEGFSRTENDRAASWAHCRAKFYEGANDPQLLKRLNDERHAEEEKARRLENPSENH